MAVTGGDTPAKPCVCASMEAAQSCSGGRGVTGSRGQAGRQGHSPALALRMLSIPALPGCPLHLGLDHAHGNARKKDLFPPSFLPYFLIQRVKSSSSTGGIFLPLSFINESQTIDVPGRQQRGCNSRGDARDTNTPCMDPARLESHCWPGANLQLGHSSGVSHITDLECQPGLLAKQQPKTTQ